jgi:membrane-associated protein
MELLDLFLHMDETLGRVIADYGVGVYGLLFAIIFAETGLVVTPFLPGDSLLFAAGAFAALGALDVRVLLALLFVAAVAGDALNYRIGRAIGKKVIAEGKLFGLRIDPRHLERTRAFYAKHGAKTIVLARFAPIIRTFAPFVAGVGEMPYATFARYNVVGGAIWVGLFTLAGYFFGELPFVRKRFEIIILAIVFVSFIPAVLEIIKARREEKK